MKISATQLQMQATSYYQRTESIHVTQERMLQNPPTAEAEDSVELSEEGRNQAQNAKAKGNNTVDETDDPIDIHESYRDAKLKARLMLIKAFLAQLDGKNPAAFDTLLESLREEMRKNDAGQNGAVNHPVSVSKPLQRGGRTVEVLTKTSHEISVESGLQFSTKAQVKTADGRTIDIDMEINMSQSFYAKVSSESRHEMKLVDPLVVNFDGPSAALTERKFAFDLDADGTTDQISQLGKGSGFLALDKNNDGTINDGTELFGTASGDGFADLAAFDQDQNGWIDESDSIFDKLRIWTHEEDGTSKLVGLGEKGIGAIFLGSVKGNYELGNVENPDGMIRRTGIFLSENGKAGTVQHVDLAI